MVSFDFYRFFFFCFYKLFRFFPGFVSVFPYLSHGLFPVFPPLLTRLARHRLHLLRRVPRAQHRVRPGLCAMPPLEETEAPVWGSLKTPGVMFYFVLFLKLKFECFL